MKLLLALAVFFAFVQPLWAADWNGTWESRRTPGMTMAVTRLDDRHYSALVKMNGKPFGTSKGELSVDGKTITVDNDYQAAGGGNPAGKYTEIWDRK
jgi:hypothetical protein